MIKQILAFIFSFMFFGSILLLPASHVSAAASKLSYIEYDGGTTMSLNSINSDGSSDSILASNSGFSNGQFGVEWSPDGTKIAYVRSNSGGSEWNIHVMNGDGSSDTALTTDNTSGAFGLSWSPDSSKIVFGSIEAGPAYIIYSINADGTGRTQLTNSGIDVCPQWSSGGKIVFVSFRDANTEIYSMNADGTAQTNLTNDGTAIDGLTGSSCTLSVSPDGDTIAYSTDRDALGSSVELYTMNIDGTSPTRLTTSPGGTGNFFPSWSNDSSRIAYGSNVDDLGGGSNGYQIYTMNANGSGQTRLTSSGGNVIITGSVFGGIRWSPDDSQIAFSSNRNGDPEVFLMNANGSNQTALVTDYSFLPRWQPPVQSSNSGGSSSSGSTTTAAATLADTGDSKSLLKTIALLLFSIGSIALAFIIKKRVWR